MAGWGLRRTGLAGALIALALPVGGALAQAPDPLRNFDAPRSNDPSQQLDADVPNVQRQDTPNDFAYDRAEPDDEDGGTSSNIFEERFDLFGFASFRTRTTARYLDPLGQNFGNAQVSGFNAAGGWKRTTGRPDVSVAVLDTGINWGNEGVRTQVALNRNELPLPKDADRVDAAEYDRNGDGAFNVDDYAEDPRVDDSAPTGQDLIRVFSDGHDGLDGPTENNGYVDDIAGWDFFDDDNDPSDTSSYFAAGNHGTGRMNEAAERGNDVRGELGVCPKCQVMPVRIWDTFVSDQNSFFMGVVYATDNGAEVIAGADGGLYHSAFAEKASQYAYEKGVVQAYSGNDLNTGNHNYPAAYDHAMLIEGVVGDTEGLGMDLPEQDGDPGVRDAILTLLNGVPGIGTMVPQNTYFRSANTAQFGGKSSISMQGPTGSTNTGKAAGAIGLVISAARARGIELRPDELRALLEQTAEDVLPGDTGPPPVGVGNPDPAQAGFDTHFGYGRANVGEAVREADEGRIPPEASIASPDWYAPVVGDSVSITGLADARESINGGAFAWRLEYGIGLAPTEAEWTEVRSGSSDGEPVTDFGEVDLAQVRAQLAARTMFRDRDDPAGPLLPKTPGLDPFQGQFSLRLIVTSEGDDEVLPGEDRHILTAVPDGQALREDFPKRLGAGGEAPIRYSDIDGDNEQELIVPAQDGLIHAYRPDGSELPGWPVRTQTQFAARRHLASPALQELEPPLEPPRAPTIADLTGDGLPEVITTAGERIYVWDHEGDLLPGWPVRPDPARENCSVAEQEPDIKHPKCGFIASPSIARLEGQDEPPSIVVPGLDGRLRAYRADGTATPGFPVRLIDLDEEEPMTAESINNPAIGDLTGDGRDDIVIATHEVYGGTGGGGDVSFGGALAAANATSRVYAVDGQGRGPDGDGDPFLPGWPIKPGGIILDVLPLVGPGHDAALVNVSGTQQIAVSVTSGALALYDVEGNLTREIQQNATPAGAGLNLFESAAIGDVDGLAGPDLVKYQVDAAQAANLLLVGQNFPYSHRMGAFSATTGATTNPNFPVITDDYQFLSSSTVADVAGGPTGQNQVLTGTGLGLLHAYDGLSGLDAPGFPKVTGGWLFAPAAISDDRRMAAITREGFLFEWDVPNTPACQAEWPSFRHDQQGTGNYDADGTPPAAPEALELQQVEGDTYTLRFRSPGDDGFCGTATRYVADVDGEEADLGEPVAGGATYTGEITLDPGQRRVTVRAADGEEDERFNLGPPGSVARGPRDGSGGAGGIGVGGGGVGADPCFRAARTVRGNRVGRAGLARRRSSVRGTFGSEGRYRKWVDRYCLRDGSTVRVAYPTHRERSRLSRSERRRIGHESIFVLTTSRSLRIRGVRRGMALRALHRRIGRGARVRVGRNLWYFRKGRNSRHIFKVQNGRVLEMGIADARLTKGRNRAKRFFRQGR